MKIMTNKKYNELFKELENKERTENLLKIEKSKNGELMKKIDELEDHIREREDIVKKYNKISKVIKKEPIDLAKLSTIIKDLDIK